MDNMYITESQSNGQSATTKFASTNSIPALISESEEINKKDMMGSSPVILRDNKGRRHSVLDDLRARRDSLFQRARRASIFEDKENNKDKDKEEKKEKRRSSDGTRRGSVFYVSDDLLEENQEALDHERQRLAEQEIKKGRRKSWHPLIKPPKLERKRRKGVAGVPTQAASGSTEALNYVRTKRSSWWNIFVPDSVTRYIIIDDIIERRLARCVSRVIYHYINNFLYIIRFSLMPHI